jgi:hypothetical protein
MAVKIFLIEYEGLKLEVTATEAGTQTSLVVRCLEGSADINALYWGDDVDDTTQVDLGKSLNMNGTGEDWDGAVRLSDPGLGKAGVTKSTYLTEGNSLAPVLADVSFADLDKLGIRATSTSTAGGSIKGYDECASTPHESSEALFTENFDYKGDESVQKTYQDNGVDVFASVNLNAANGWVSGAPVGNINGSNPANSELGADGYGGIQATSPAPNGTDGFWLDTQNTPGQINISHVFEDNTTAIDGKTAVRITRQTRTRPLISLSTVSWWHTPALTVTLPRASTPTCGRPTICSTSASTSVTPPPVSTRSSWSTRQLRLTSPASRSTASRSATGLSDR